MLEITLQSRSGMQLKVKVPETYTFEQLKESLTKKSVWHILIDDVSFTKATGEVYTLNRTLREQDVTSGAIIHAYGVKIMAGKAQEILDLSDSTTSPVITPTTPADADHKNNDNPVLISTAGSASNAALLTPEHSIPSAAPQSSPSPRLDPDEIKQPRYLNTETILLNSVQDIPEDKLLVLDDYAFDVDEFLANIEGDRFSKIYTNPHLENTSSDAEFSETAKSILRSHPILSQHAREYDERLRVQKTGISAETIDRVTHLALCYAVISAEHRNAASSNIEDSDQTNLAAFLEYKAKLPEQERADLDDYIIRVTSRFGGTQNLSFQSVLKSSCIVQQQIFLWQFVVELRPESAVLVPEHVHQQARSNDLEILNTAISRAPVNHAPTHAIDEANPTPELLEMQNMRNAILARFAPGSTAIFAIRRIQHPLVVLDRPFMLVNEPTADGSHLFHFIDLTFTPNLDTPTHP
jgi:hypothetical protein